LLLVAAAATEAILTTITRVELLDQAKYRLDDRNKDKLRNPIEWVDREWFAAPVPTTNHQRSLVIRVDQPDQITKDDAVLMTKA